jgi:hypothetical protein
LAFVFTGRRRLEIQPLICEPFCPVGRVATSGTRFLREDAGFGEDEMKTPLARINILSIYKKNNVRVQLPDRMALCTPDTHNSIMAVKGDLEGQGGKLFLSDLFRSYDMQLQSHLDFKNGKKKAFSPPPGGSLHEAGRALDLDLDSLKISLEDFWAVAKRHGFFPIITTPNPKKSEAWHFDCRGSHNIVYDYYKAEKGANFTSPYAAMAASAILAIGVRVDRFGDNQKEAYLQSCLVRLGQELGSIDGQIGQRTRNALGAVGVQLGAVESMIEAAEDLLQTKFPGEFSAPQDSGPDLDADFEVPEHVID